MVKIIVIEPVCGGRFEPILDIMNFGMEVEM
jgi:hypothetical protein